MVNARDFVIIKFCDSQAIHDVEDISSKTLSDLTIDSLELMELIMEIEDELKVNITDETINPEMTVKEFINKSAKKLGIAITWKYKGLKEVGYNKQNGKDLIKVDPVYFRPTEINELRGDSSKARKELKWKPKTNFKELVKEMMISDLEEIN